MNKKITLAVFFIIALTTGKLYAISTDSLEQNTKLILEAYILKGNKHTRDAVIMRELQVKPGEKVSVYELPLFLENVYSRLMNSSLFNDVQIKDSIAGNQLYIICDLRERWFIYPLPVLNQGGLNVGSWLSGKNFHMMNYGLRLVHYNFRGRKEYLELKAVGGFSREFSIDYEIPAINKKRTLGLNIAAAFAANNKVNASSDNCKLQSIQLKRNIVWKQYYSLGLVWRPGIFTSHNLTFSFDYASVSDTVFAANPHYFTNKKKSMGYFSLNYFLKLDKRDWYAYPKKGYLWELSLTQTGLGIEPVNSLNMFRASTLFYYYQPIAGRFYAAAGISVLFSASPSQPYSMQSALGYDEYVRGYEPYVIPGQHYSVLKTNLRYGLLKRKVFRLKKIKWNEINTIPLALYLGMHCDAAYVSDSKQFFNNPLANRVRAGYGFGLDVVTIYSIVFRFEYSFTEKGNNGFFFSIGKAF